MGHYILKDGGYIQYGPKTIPALKSSEAFIPIASEIYEVSTTSTTASTIGTIVINGVTIGDTFLIDSKDVDGIRTDHFIGCRQNIAVKGAGTQTLNYLTRADSSGDLVTNNASNGIYVSAATLADDVLTLTISSKYNATNTKTINGNYAVTVYRVNL